MERFSWKLKEHDWLVCYRNCWRRKERYVCMCMWTVSCCGWCGGSYIVIPRLSWHDTPFPQQTEEACDIIQDVHVETYGSLDKKEKVDFILEQIRLTLAKKDFIRCYIISKKVSERESVCACVCASSCRLSTASVSVAIYTHTAWQVTRKLLEGDELQDLKIKFYRLMIEYHSLSEKSAFDICQHYHHVYDTPSVKADESQWKEALKSCVIFLIISPHR